MDRIEGQQGPENHYAKYVQWLLVPDANIVRQLVRRCADVQFMPWMARHRGSAYLCCRVHTCP